MENKKTKLTLSGIAKKSIENIELAKTQSKNSVVIEKKPSKFAPRGNFTRPASVRSKPAVTLQVAFLQELHQHLNHLLQLLMIMKNVN